LSSAVNLSLFASPALRHIIYKTSIIFRVLCFGTANSDIFANPEPAARKLEGIELLYNQDRHKTGSKKLGGSRTEAEIQLVVEKKVHSREMYGHGAGNELMDKKEGARARRGWEEARGKRWNSELLCLEWLKC
jgi:hypothetical protein